MKDAAIALALTDGVRAASETLLMDATNPWELDAAMVAYGFAVGVCEAQDLEGLDVGLARRAGPQAGTGKRTIPILPRMVSEGRLGRKVGVGWYRYPGGGGLVIDPLVEDLLREEAWFAGVTRQDLDDAVLVERIIMGMTQSALALLVQGVGHARIDQISIDAVGFPPGLGGVLSHVAFLGQAEVMRCFERMPWPARYLQQTQANLGAFFGAENQISSGR